MCIWRNYVYLIILVFSLVYPSKKIFKKNCTDIYKTFFIVSKEYFARAQYDIAVDSSIIRKLKSKNKLELFD